MSALVTFIEVLEVATGVVALGLAYLLQVVTDREVHIKFWGAFYVVGAALVLSHLGVFIPDPKTQAWLKFLVVLALLSAELVAAHWVWEHADVPELLNDTNGGGR